MSDDIELRVDSSSPPTADIACPTCDATDSYSFPRSAHDFAVSASVDAALDDRVHGGDRFRHQTNECSNGHAVHFYFAW